jgi:hypothetical protein
MGASSSSAQTTVNEINATTIGLNQKTFNDIQNTCNSNTSQHNVLNIIGSTVTKLNTAQKNVGKNICILQTAINTVQDATAQNAMMASIKTALEQQASAGIGIANANSNTNTNINNTFNASVSNETINKAITGCINNLDQSNVMNIIGSNITDSNLDQNNDSFMQCLSNNGATTQQSAGVASTTTATSDVTQSQSSKGYDPIASLTGLLGVYMLPCIICCVLCVILILGASAMGLANGGHANIDSSGNFTAGIGKSITQQLPKP